MEPKDFYFELSHNASGTFFLITPVAYYETEGCLSDKSGVADAVLPKGFYELMESTYEYDGNIEIGRQILLDLGFKEISFGLSPGEQSVNSATNPNLENEDDDNDLDILLNETPDEPYPFDYKNVATDKLLRHLKMMVSTDSFEEAAKIRDELNSRTATT